MNPSNIEKIVFPSKKKAFNNVYIPLLTDTNRTFVIYGGRGSAKSAFAAQYVILDLLKRPYSKWIAIRKVFNSIQDTQYPALLWAIENWKMESFFHVTKKPMEITCLKNGNKIIFKGLDRPDKAKSIQNPTAAWFEEGNEISYEDYIKTKTSLRGPKGSKLREIITFNPENEESWINTMFFPAKETYETEDGDFHYIPSVKKNVTILHTTYKDNKFLQESEIEELEGLKDVDDNFYKVYTLGKWGGALKGLVYPNWTIYNEEPSGGDTVYGLDFGFNDPMALVKVTRKEKNLYIRELFYKKGWTTTELINILPNLIENKHIEIYADHEPDRIEEIYQRGYNIKPADKGANSIIAGIDFLKNFKIHIHRDSFNTIREIKKYVYKRDKEDRTLELPIDLDNHALDATRMAANTHGRKFWLGNGIILPSQFKEKKSRFGMAGRFG